MDRLEIEIKAYCDNKNELINRLRDLGAEFVKEMEEVDQYYNHPSRNFIETDEALRIRREDDKYFFTYKGPKLGTRSKARIEEESEVADFVAMDKILKHLGFIKSGVVSKKRTLYLLSGINICIDEVDGLGLFTELEKIGTDRKSIEDKLFRMAEVLNLTKFERKSYIALLYGEGE